MTAKKSPKAKDSKVRYDGSSCLNIRAIRTACRTLFPGEDTPSTITWVELANVLWFVETCVTAKGVFYDGTVPAKTARAVVDDLDRLREHSELDRLIVRPIEYRRPEDILTNAGFALLQSRLLLDSFQMEPGLDRPVDAPEHERFLAELRGAAELSPASRRDRATEYVAHPFRGSKALAAILVQEDDTFDAALALYEGRDADGPLVTGALINRFRLNYVNQLASGKKSAYVPNPNFEPLTNEHVRLFKDYLLERMIRSLPADQLGPNLLVENFSRESPLPPLGLYALMATRARGRPAAVLETALNEFREDAALMKLLWAGTRGGLELKRTLSPEEYAEEVESHFFSHYKSLEKAAAGIQQTRSRLRRPRAYVIPAVLQSTVQILPRVLGVGGLAEVVFGLVREAAGQASVNVLCDSLAVNGCNSYLSVYKSLKWDLQNEDSIRATFADLADRVEAVFGRTLVTE